MAMAWSRMVVLASAAALLFGTGAVVVAKDEPVLISVGPSISFEPGNVRIVSRVEPSAANRALVIEVESGSHYSSSEVPLEGEQAPRSRAIFLKNLPAGDYQVVATLRKETGAATVIRGAFQVVSGRAEDQ
jgi:hypothetical protein